MCVKIYQDMSQNIQARIANLVGKSPLYTISCSVPYSSGIWWGPTGPSISNPFWFIIIRVMISPEYYSIFTTRCWKNRHNFSPDHGNAAKFSKNIHLGLSFLQFPIKPRHLRKLVRRFGLTKNLLDGRICWFSFLWRGFQDPTVRRIIQRNLHESLHRLQQKRIKLGRVRQSSSLERESRRALTRCSYITSSWRTSGRTVRIFYCDRWWGQKGGHKSKNVEKPFSYTTA